MHEQTTQGNESKEREIGIQIGIRFSAKSFLLFLSFFFRKETTQPA